MSAIRCFIILICQSQVLVLVAKTQFGAMLESHNVFSRFLQLIDLVQKGLADYLETKRLAFSRFFFLSNDELLQILSQAKNPLAVQPHLHKCFEAIDRLDFQADMEITAMNSAENEKVV